MIMDITQILFLLSTFLAAIGLIIIIYSRDSQNITSRLFILILFLVIGYLISHGFHFLLMPSHDVTILDISCHSFLFMILITLTFFTWNFPPRIAERGGQESQKIGFIRFSFILLPSLLLLFALWSGNLVHESHADAGKFIADYGSLYPLFLIWYLILLFLNVFWLLKKHETESNLQLKRQILLFLVGLIITNLASFFFGLFLPWILGFYYLVEISPLAFLIGVILFTTVAVGKYDMFPATLEKVRSFSINRKIFLSALVIVPIVILLIQIPIGKTLFGINTSSELTRFFLISLFGGIIVSVSMSFIILKVISNPINNLKTKALEIQKGNYGINVDFSSNDEIGELAEAFNNMSRTLEMDLYELKNREERISLLLNAFERSLAAIAVVNSDFKIIEVNTKFCEIVEKNKGAIINHSLKKLQFGDENSAEFEKIISALQKENKFNGEIILNPRTEKTKYLLISVTPTIIREDELCGYLFVEVDITDRKKLEDQLLKAEKLAALGEMAAVLAHEVKTPLTSIKMNTDILLETLNLHDEDKIPFTIIQKEIVRLNNLVKDVLQFSRQMELIYSEFYLKDLLENIHIQVQNKLQLKNAALRIKPNNFKIRADIEKLKQVFLNLIDNSIEAIESNGEITISADEIDENKIAIQITDNGKSIQQPEKIFEPFFTTKASGTGLGLAISQKIIEQHKGSIKLISSKPGKTIFEIVLPKIPYN